MATPPIALTIAGSDSSGGAGIQADLNTFAALGVYGATAITAITAQNTTGVQGIEVVAPAFVDEQLASILADLRVAAVKTGMLATAAMVETAARRAAAGVLPNLVVDPVMVAASGDRLLDENAERAYVDHLFPHARVITPNLAEAACLVGHPIQSLADMRAAATELVATGAGCVVVKGGHMIDGEGAEESIDVMVCGGDITELRAPRVDTRNVHGTGCTFSAAIAALLARGHGDAESVTMAKSFVTAAITAGAAWRIGRGSGPVGHAVAGRAIPEQAVPAG